MKKLFLFVAAAALLAGCEKEAGKPAEPADGLRITFVLNGDFNSPTFTRALTADGYDMTDVWVFDYSGGELIQHIHQTNDESDFGTPSLTLANGEHNLCFVASRGDSPALNMETRTITWSKPKDTFWGDYDINVEQGTAGAVTVTLNRVATKLKLTINDEIPSGLSQLTATPATWYNGLNYWIGEPAGLVTSQPRTVSVPESYIGTTGQLVFSIFGMSASAEWQTDIAVTATDASGNELGRATIADAPFMANRQTAYSGRLFSQDGAFSLTLNDTWQTDYEAEW